MGGYMAFPLSLTKALGLRVHHIFSAATPMYPLLSDLRSEATSDLISTQMVELYLYFIDTGTGFERI